MKTVMLVTTIALVLLASASGAGAAVIPSNWSERVEYSSGAGFMRLYVRKLEVTKSGWKASVGLRNSSKIPVQVTSTLQRPSTSLPFTYWAGPGVWWSQYVRGGSWWPGSGTILTHSARATVRPQYPSRLGPGKSWFGTFSGSLAKVPKDRLLRIGFGTLVLPSNVRLKTGYLPREVALSTTHQFRLPKQL
jgi:hypothetical protein